MGRSSNHLVAHGCVPMECIVRAFGAVMRKGTQAGNNIQLGSDGRGFLEL